jgi:membrane protein implicated in regulation of membrane protease activity
MNPSEKIASWISTLVPVVALTVLLEAPPWWVFTLFLLCPILVIYLVWRVLNEQNVSLPELPAGHEWGYLDRRDLQPVGE